MNDIQPSAPKVSIRVLSIQQPWAWLIVNGFKDVENRTWPTRFRGKFLVHASKRPSANIQIIRNEVRARFHIEIPNVLDLGGVVGEAEIVDCGKSCPSGWFEGPWGFVLAGAKCLPFQALRGKLGFFSVAIDPEGRIS